MSSKIQRDLDPALSITSFSNPLPPLSVYKGS